MTLQSTEQGLQECAHIGLQSTEQGLQEGRHVELH